VHHPPRGLHVAALNRRQVRRVLLRRDSATSLRPPRRSLHPATLALRILGNVRTLPRHFARSSTPRGLRALCRYGVGGFRRVRSLRRGLFSLRDQMQSIVVCMFANVVVSDKVHRLFPAFAHPPLVRLLLLVAGSVVLRPRHRLYRRLGSRRDFGPAVDQVFNLRPAAPHHAIETKQPVEGAYRRSASKRWHF